MSEKPKVGKESKEIPIGEKVSDYIDEFVTALRKQLDADHARWGNTWLNRPKEGQELRTKARYTDYFDMFEQAGTPVPWMKVIGGALICWIREQHPELCIGKPKIETTALERAIVNEVEEACACKDTNITIKALGHDGPCENEKAVEDMTTKELVESGPTVQHKSDCAVHNEPALPKGGCDCQNDALPPSECHCEDYNLPDIKGIINWSKQAAETLDQLVAEKIKEKTPLPSAHVCNERIAMNTAQGTLGYSSKNGKDGKIILESIKFTIGAGQDAPELGRCNKTGLIIPTSRAVGILGGVKSNGRYRLTAVKGVGSKDTVYVTYDYEYRL